MHAHSVHTHARHRAAANGTSARPEVAAHCHRRLKRVKEQFKRPRKRVWARECARRWRGIAPMIEYFSSKTNPMYAKNKKTGRYTKGWREHVMVTTNPGPTREQREQAWARVDNPTEPSDEAEKVEEEAPANAIYMTPSAFDLLYMVDGFTVYDCRSEARLGNWVFVRDGQALPTYVHVDCNNSPSSKSVSRLHFLMVLGPGGVVLCALLRSATKLSPGKASDDLEFWWDLIPQLLDEEDLDGADPKEIQKQMSMKTWLVCSVCAPSTG